MKKIVAPLFWIMLFVVASVLSGCTMVMKLAVGWMNYTQDAYFRDQVPAGGWVDPEWDGIPRSVTILYSEPMFDGYASFKKEWPEYGGNFSGWFKQQMNNAAATLNARTEVMSVDDSAFAMESRKALWHRYGGDADSVAVPVLREKYRNAVEEVAVVISPIVVVASERADTTGAKTVKALYSITDVKRGKLLAYGKVDVRGEMGRTTNVSLSEKLLHLVVESSPMEQVRMSPMGNDGGRPEKRSVWKE